MRSSKASVFWLVILLAFLLVPFQNCSHKFIQKKSVFDNQEEPFGFFDEH